MFRKINSKVNSEAKMKDTRLASPFLCQKDERQKDHPEFSLMRLQKLFQFWR